MKHLLIIVSVLFGLAQVVQADEAGQANETVQKSEFKPYVGGGLGVGLISLQITGGVSGSERGNAFVGYGSIGFDYGKYLGAELRVGSSGTATTTFGGGVNVDSRIDWFASYLGKLQYPISEQFKVYGLLGATTVRRTDTFTTPGLYWLATGTAKYSRVMTDASIGIGVDYKTADQWEVGIEAMSYRARFDAVTASLKYTF